jgi:hypothetical protein
MERRIKSDRTVKVHNGDSRPRTKTSQREKTKAKRKQKHFPETRPCPREENRSENGKSSGARGGEATSTEFINFAGSLRKAFTFLCFHLFGFHPFCSVSFGFPHFLFLFAFLRFSLPASFLLFRIFQTNSNTNW